MARRNSTVVLPAPTASASVLRRSARLTSREMRDSQVKPGEDFDSGSEAPRKSHRKLGPEVSSKRLVYSLNSSVEDLSSKKSPGLDESMKECSSLRRSLRVSNKGCSDAGKEKRFQCTSPSRVKVSCSYALRRSPRFKSGGESVDCQYSSIGTKSGKSVLSRCSTRSIEKGEMGDGFIGEKIRELNYDNKNIDPTGLRSRDRSRSRLRPKTKQMFRVCDDDGEEDVSVCLSVAKKMRTVNEKEEEIVMPKADEGKRTRREEEGEEEEGLKTKKKVEKGWTEEMELALQRAYLTVKPSPNFWKKVSKMVPGKSAQECFDRVNSDLITPRQTQPRSRASKANLSAIPQFSLSASKLLIPDSRKRKIRPRRGNTLSKKAIRQLLEKQKHMDQGLGIDLFSVFEPSTMSNLVSTPTQKGQHLPKISESPRFASEDRATLVSPPVLKQVKNRALHEKYIDHLHTRDAKRKAEFTRLARKENIRPIENQKKDSVRGAKDALLSDVQDAMQKLKSLETENTASSSSESCYDRGEIDEEDES